MSEDKEAFLDHQVWQLLSLSHLTLDKVVRISTLAWFPALKYTLDYSELVQKRLHIPASRPKVTFVSHSPSFEQMCCINSIKRLKHISNSFLSWNFFFIFRLLHESIFKRNIHTIPIYSFIFLLWRSDAVSGWIMERNSLQGKRLLVSSSPKVDCLRFPFQGKLWQRCTAPNSVVPVSSSEARSLGHPSKCRWLTALRVGAVHAHERGSGGGGRRGVVVHRGFFGCFIDNTWAHLRERGASKVCGGGGISILGSYRLDRLGELGWGGGG